eukprot:CAMPEP_0206541342 /NCGR_PEP_ID=MMETSP0325_2-20121206/9553_1 /ASSEMBLY_ACC=CAM_ASM_000347 /TAXON_ID=2866 /ORGANISM="Crypthecodinium cohnii, Strain Seligo" /LENGTH=164 /DNA_ID=CAMNT_0054039257 /DNA_START=279 /DNA_END=769 /DNA_ORIENTATION=+
MSFSEAASIVSKASIVDSFACSLLDSAVQLLPALTDRAIDCPCEALRSRSRNFLSSDIHSPSRGRRVDAVDWRCQIGSPILPDLRARQQTVCVAMSQRLVAAAAAVAAVGFQAAAGTAPIEPKPHHAILSLHPASKAVLSIPPTVRDPGVGFQYLEPPDWAGSP